MSGVRVLSNDLQKVFVRKLCADVTDLDTDMMAGDAGVGEIYALCCQLGTNLLHNFSKAMVVHSSIFKRLEHTCVLPPRGVRRKPNSRYFRIY